MTPGEAITAAGDKLRDDIEALVEKFEAETGVRVTKIALDHRDDGVYADVYVDLFEGGQP